MPRANERLPFLALCHVRATLVPYETVERQMAQANKRNAVGNQSIESPTAAVYPAAKGLSGPSQPAYQIIRAP